MQRVREFSMIGQTGQHGPIVIPLVDANAAPGIYQLNDFLYVLSSDSVTMSMTLAYNPRNGPASFTSSVFTGEFGPNTALTCLALASSLTAVPMTFENVRGAATLTISFDSVPTSLLFNYSGVLTLL